ncbi:MAG: helix-turn-helix domain-containing protein [Acidobacteriia bacterium]|nr:helix-turn-helix domain-containing protein [Terriglobia bacterium]
MSDSLFLNLNEAAQLLGLSPEHLYELTRKRSRERTSNPVPHLHLGRRLVFRREDLRAWAASIEVAR